MNKKVMAVAVAGALAAPGLAMAQTSTVQIGGSLTGFYYSHSPKNASVGQRTDIMETSEPEMFVRGEEKLGGGLSAWFQCTSSLDGMIGGAGAIADSGWCARNSGMGFQGSWGNIFFGNWDQPLKFVQNAARGWWGGTNAFTGGAYVLLGGGAASGTTNATNVVSFFRRQANTLNYHSPSWNGFSVQGAMSAANEGTGIPEASPLNPRMWSMAGQYRSGPLYAGLGYERHNDFNPAGQAAAAYSGGTDTNMTITAGYTFGSFNIRGTISQTEYDTTNTTGLDTNGWALFADWALQGPHTLRAHYIKVDDTSGNSAVNVGSHKGPLGVGCGSTFTGAGVSNASCASGTGAKQWALAYSYAFSKRTMGSVAYVKMDNDRNATYSKGKVASSSGNTQTSMGVIMQHRF